MRPTPHLPSNPSPFSGEVRRYLPCHLGPLRLAFDVSTLDGIRRSDSVQWNPSADGPAGWLLDYEEIPVLDLAPWLGVEPRHGRGSSLGRVLVFRTAQGPRGLLVDTCGRARDVQGGDLFAVPTLVGDMTALGLQALWASEEHPWLVLDPEAPDFDGQPRHGPEPAAVPSIASPAWLAESPALRPIDGRPIDGQPIDSHPGGQAQDRGRLLVFSSQLGESFARPVRFALSLRQVLEVASLSERSPIPGAPSWVRGVCLWRRQPLPIVDLDHYLGLAPPLGHDDASELDSLRLVVAGGIDGQRLGILTSGAPRLLRLPVAHRPSDFALDPATALGIFELEDETIILPDLDRLCHRGGN